MSLRSVLHPTVSRLLPRLLHRRHALLALAALLGATACSSGGGDAQPASLGLDGTWFGTEETDVGDLVALRATVSGSRVTQIVVDGADTGLTGSITPIPGRPNFYDLALSDGTEGGFLIDSTQTYAVFLDEDFNFGVLQRGASTLPNAGATDIYGRTYEGRTVFIDASFSITDVLDSTVTVAVDGTFQGSYAGGTTFTSAAALTLLDATFGAWGGAYDATGPMGPDSGPLRVFASPDKQFIGAWACSSGGSFPVDCSFSVWRVQ
ncbi:MAG: hypothetical protein AAGB93_25440 [Planctomycetota bacterium]